MAKPLSVVVLTVLMIGLLDALVATTLWIANAHVPALRPVSAFFELGRSVPGKLAAWERSPGSGGNLFDAAWRDEILAMSAREFAAEDPAAGPVLRVYGMSFANDIALAAQAQDPSLRVDVHAGPGAPPNFTFMMFLDDAANRRSGDVAVLAILSSGVPAVAAMSNRTWVFEQPAPFTYPVFRPDGASGLSRTDPIIGSAAQERAARGDLDLQARWDRQLAQQDALYTAAAFGWPALDGSPLVRLLRRAVATGAIEQRKRSMLNDGFPVTQTLQRMVTVFAATARADGQRPVVLLIQTRDPRDPDLSAMLRLTLEDRAIAYLATVDVNPPNDPSGFLSDGHFTPAVNQRLGQAFLTALANAR